MNDSASEVPSDSLTCPLPLELLSKVAAQLDSTTFTLLLRPIFGNTLPPNVFLRLRQTLLDNALENPIFRIHDALEETCIFDAEGQAIDVQRESLDRALEQPEQSALLLIALLGAFARYIDARVRGYFAEVQPGDAPTPLAPTPNNLGEDFIGFLLFYAEPVEPGTVFAHYTRAGSEHALELAKLSAPVEMVLRFGAGTGNAKNSNSFGHESIEFALKDVGFSQEQCRRIYFGNWLRDFSQVIDPKLLRPQGDFSGWTVLQELLEAQLPKLTREQLTAIVDLLALRQFHDLQTTPQGRQAYKVDPAMLGVYRAFEHIDNPTTLDREAINPKSIDKDFQPLVFPEDPSNSTLCKSSMKQYIRRPIAFMKKRLQAAQEAGPTPEGMRLFGEALHILEDYLAHSNFVELSLKKQGHDEVLVWTPRVDSREESTHKWPVITGMFSSLDVLGSVIEPLTEILFPTSDSQETLAPGERQAHEKAILILLDDGEHSAALAMYKLYLEARAKIESNWLYSLLNKATKPVQSLKYALNKVKKPLLKLAGDQIANLQIYLSQDPNTDPNTFATHSQLSKDHDTHPFHTLAVELASYAVSLVGQAMYDQWQGKEGAQDPAKVARKLIRHPYDCDWQEIIVRQWAQENPGKVEQGKSLETLRSLQCAELQELCDDINNALNEMEDYFAELEQLTDTSLWQIGNAPPDILY